VAISFVSQDTEAHFRLIEKRQGLNLIREQVEGFEPEIVLAPLQNQILNLTLQHKWVRMKNHPTIPKTVA
jgi:hypothetical protein